MNSPLFIGGLRFLKNHRRGDKDFLIKMGEGEGVVHIGRLSIEGGGGSKHCFLLIRYEFCWSNALYSASLSFRTFIFLLTPFDTLDCYCFGLNLSLVLLIKVLFIKKLCNAFEFILVFIWYLR